MFTGLVQATGNIQTRSSLGNGIECSIQAPSGFVSDIAIGDSINVNGVCSTAISKTDTTFTVQYLEETPGPARTARINSSHTPSAG